MQNTFSSPILAIDTSTNYLSLALQIDKEIMLQHIDVGNKQSELILPQIQLLLNKANIHIQDLSAIVYAQGPGGFTGLRIGTGVAQGLSAPFHIPLIGIPCLDAVAYQIKAEWVLAATDARMGEVFYAWFNTQQAQRLTPYQVGKAIDIIIPDGANNPQGIGNAFGLTETQKIQGINKMPTAEQYLTLAQTGCYPATDAAHVELLYIRNKIALTTKEQATQKANTSCHALPQ